MRSETISIHNGYDVEPTTKVVAVPIYQSMAYEFDGGRARSLLGFGISGGVGIEHIDATAADRRSAIATE